MHLYEGWVHPLLYPLKGLCSRVYPQNPGQYQGALNLSTLIHGVCTHQSSRFPYESSTQPGSRVFPSTPPASHVIYAPTRGVIRVVPSGAEHGALGSPLTIYFAKPRVYPRAFVRFQVPNSTCAADKLYRYMPRAMIFDLTVCACRPCENLGQTARRAHQPNARQSSESETPPQMRGSQVGFIRETICLCLMHTAL